MGGESHALTRRSFLTGAGAAALAAGADAGSAQDGGGATRRIDMTDDLVFDPDDVTVAPGTTVVWETVGSIPHTVTAYDDGVPEGGDYFASGGFGSEDAARDAYPRGEIGAGGTYEHTFETLGTFEYFCIPHETVGMTGTVEVAEGGGQQAEDTGPTFPDSALTLGVALSIALVTTLSLGYFFLRYGGDYRDPGGGDGDRSTED